MMEKILYFFLLALNVFARSAHIDDPNSKAYHLPSYANSSVCYPTVGCFSNGGAFSNNLYLPADPVNINTQFLFFTKTDKTKGKFISYKDNSSIKNSGFNKTLPTKVLVHGFSNNLNSSWLFDLKDAILNNDNANVIITGWGNGATFPYYYEAAANTRIVGKEISLVLENIKKQFALDATYKIHCIGHSLGSQICGHAGETTKLDRISGLDPAGPLFFNQSNPVRLDPSDATYIDAYHSNAGVLSSGSFGYNGTVGHVDFWPNGGYVQPGCPANLQSSIWHSIEQMANPADDVGCSHSRAVAYYIRSINPSSTFTAFKCANKASFDKGLCSSCDNNNCAVFGYRADKTKPTGTYYLSTMNRAPFDGNQYMFKIHFDKSSKLTSGELFLYFDDISNVSLTSGNNNFVMAPNTELSGTFAIPQNVQANQNVKIKFVKHKTMVSYFVSDSYAKEIVFDKIQLVKFGTTKLTLNNCDAVTTLKDGDTVSKALKSVTC